LILASTSTFPLISAMPWSEKKKKTTSRYLSLASESIPRRLSSTPLTAESTVSVQVPFSAMEALIPLKEIKAKATSLFRRLCLSFLAFSSSEASLL